MNVIQISKEFIVILSNCDTDVDLFKNLYYNNLLEEKEIIYDSRKYRY